MKGTHRFDNVVEVTLCAQDAAGPADDPVPVGNKPCAFRGTAFKHVQNVPDVVHGELRFTHAHAEAEQRRLPLGLGLLGVRDIRMR